MLKVDWWHKQQEIANALIQHKRVMVKASHGVGKSHVCAGLVNWFFDCWTPSETLTTAPNHAQVVDVLWKEVRVQRGNRPHLMPKAPELFKAANHYAKGITASTGGGFQGRHGPAGLIGFDEATDINDLYWDSATGMLTGENWFMFAILNPTTTACRAYEEEMSGRWHVITISALDHPNIGLELAGKEPLHPYAVRLQWVRDRIDEWCEAVPAGDQRSEDFEFPPGSGIWYRPGPLFEGRVLGRWPSQGTYSLWSEALWYRALNPQKIDMELPVQIGCDVARFGDDNTEIVVRRGACVLHHEWHNGWNTVQTSARLKELACRYADAGDPKQIRICIDDDGVGGGVVDQRDGYKFIGVNAGGSPIERERYPNVRSELWFVTRDRAEAGNIDLSRLSEKSLNNLRLQAMAPTWKPDSQGRRVVEPKDATKKRIKRSPDGMDALNLAFCTPPEVRTEEWIW